MAKRNPTIDDEPLIKGEDESEEGEAVDEGAVGDEGMDDEEDEDEEDEDAEKSDMTEMDLVKALDEMDNLANASANGISPRQQQLAAKLARGESLTKSERAELADSDEPMAKSHKESFVENPNIAQGFEVSEFLDALTSKVTDALDESRAEMSKSFAEVGEFNKALAKSLNAMGALIIAQDKKIRQLEKSLAEGAAPALMRVEAAPAKGAARTSAVGQKVNEGMRKSAGAGGTTLTKSQILDTLDDQIQKSAGGIVDGVDLVLESSRYETTHLLSPDAMRIVCKARGIDPSAVGLNG